MLLEVIFFFFFISELDIHELLGQGFFIFIAGYETTAGLLSYLSYFLAIYPEIQEKLIEEVDEHIKDVSVSVTTMEQCSSEGRIAGIILG